jgi:DNA-binding NarL/FixJ family response regulator
MPSPSPAGQFAPPPKTLRGSRSKAGGVEASEAAQHPARILIVEDDFLIAMQTEAALTEAGFHVVGTAISAEEAIALATELGPVLAVMDIRLAGERDGIDAARELFQDLDIRCILASAHDDPHTRGRAEPYAPLGWLTKPYTMESLISLVRKALAALD